MKPHLKLQSVGLVSVKEQMSEARRLYKTIEGKTHLTKLRDEFLDTIKRARERKVKPIL